MKIRKVTLKTDKLEDLHNFYSKILRIECEAAGNSLTLRTGATELSFESDTNFPGAFYHFAFNIPENQLEDSIQWLKGKAELIKLDGEHIFDFKAWDAHSIYFYDPAGNIVEFIARHRLNNASSAAFTGKSIISVSEIGMPVLNVRAFYDKLYKEFDLPLFTGDLKTFTAAGDDNGLIIIVPEERIWFPDCGPAGIFPISVEFEGIKNNEILFNDYGYSVKSVKHRSVSD